MQVLCQLILLLYSISAKKSENLFDNRKNVRQYIIMSKLIFLHLKAALLLVPMSIVSVILAILFGLENSELFKLFMAALNAFFVFFYYLRPRLVKILNDANKNFKN